MLLDTMDSGVDAFFGGDQLKEGHGVWKAPM